MNYKKSIPLDLCSDDIFTINNSEGTKSCKVSLISDKNLHQVILFEKSYDKEFHTEIIISSSPQSPWFWVKSESNKDLMAMPPVFISDIIDISIDRSKYSGSQRHNYITTVDGVNALAELMESDSRDLPLFVITTDFSTQNFNYVSRSIRKWSQSLIGVAEFHLLSAFASEYYAENYATESFRIDPWSVRVVNPDFSFNDPQNGIKHRFVGRKRILDTTRESANIFLLGRIARSYSNKRAIPREVVDAKSEYTLKSNRELLYKKNHSSIVRETSISDELPYSRDKSISLLSAIKEASELIGIYDVSQDLIYDYAESYDDKESFTSRRDEIFERLENYQTELSSLEADNELYLKMLESSEKDVINLEDKLQTLERQVNYLQNELLKSSSPEKAYAYDYTDNSPETFEDLTEILDSDYFEFISFTGDLKIMCRLDELDTQSTAIKSTWRILCCINDYGRFKNEDATGNLWNYLNDPPPGFQTVPVSNFALQESETTQNQFGDKRIFPVPVSNRFPNGYTAMWSHFRIRATGFGTKLPRLHLLDDTDDGNMIYVGYIGPHLTTAGTN